MSPDGQDSSNRKREPSPSRFLFVSSGGIHDTLKKDVRTHVSRYNRREARARVAPDRRGTLTWKYQPSAALAPKVGNKATKRFERQDDALVVVPVPSASSPDSGYDSTSSDLLQEVIGPLRHTQDRLDSMALADDVLIGLVASGGDTRSEETVVDIFPQKEQRHDGQSIAGAAYAGDSQAMGLLSQQSLFQPGSAWSPIDSMPLDPFDSLPLQLSHFHQKVLLSFQIIPGAVYRVPGSRIINNCRDWAFPLIVKTPMLIYAAMAVVAAGREMRMGIEHSPATLTYKSCHIRTLNQWIRSPMKWHSAEVLIGIAALIASEHYQGWSPSLALHVRAFSQILRARGGWSSFKDDPKSGWFLFGQATMWSQVTVASLFGAEDTLPAFRNSIAADIQDLLKARDGLLQLLSSWIIWAQRQVNIAINDVENEIRYDHFLGPGSLLFKLLRYPEYLESAKARTVEVERSHQLFSVIYLLLVRWDYRDCPQHFVTFLDALSRQMRLHDVNKTSTTIPLVWLFIRGVDDRPQRKVQALELLKILHILQAELKERLLQFLLRLLLFNPSSCPALFSSEDIETLDRAIALILRSGRLRSTDHEEDGLREHKETRGSKVGT